MEFKKVFITGGAGYVGSALVPALLAEGYHVTVYDLYIYKFRFEDHPNLVQIEGDIRDEEKMSSAMAGCDAVIHLACISNDPSFDLDPELGESINYGAFRKLVTCCKDNDIKRLVVASSTSQYGVKPMDVEVTEDAEPEPITDYSKFKIKCERYLERADVGDMQYVFVRPATLCGYAPRLRLDLSVNILTIHALENGKITVFGGKQMRPALNLKDMVRFYQLMLKAPKEKIHGEAFNISYENVTIMQLAQQVKQVVEEALGGKEIDLVVTPTNDPRSYHINTDKMKNVLGFECRYDFKDSILSLVQAHKKGLIVDGVNNPIYHNIKRMKEIDLR